MVIQFAPSSATDQRRSVNFSVGDLPSLSRRATGHDIEPAGVEGSIARITPEEVVYASDTSRRTDATSRKPAVGYRA